MKLYLTLPATISRLISHGADINDAIRSCTVNRLTAQHEQRRAWFQQNFILGAARNKVERPWGKVAFMREQRHGH